MLLSRRAHPAFEADDEHTDTVEPPPLQPPAQPPSPLLTARAADVPLQSQERPTARALRIEALGGEHEDRATMPLLLDDSAPRAPHPATAAQPLARSAIRGATSPPASKVQSPLGILQAQNNALATGSTQHRTARFPYVVPLNADLAAASASNAAAAATSTAAPPAASGAQTTRQQLLHRSHSVSATPARAPSPAPAAHAHRRPLSTSSVSSPLTSPYAVARNALDAAVSPSVGSPLAKQVAWTPTSPTTRGSVQRAFAVDAPIRPASDLTAAGMLPLLRGLSDREFRRVVERWLEGELAAPAPVASAASVSAPAVPAARASSFSPSSPLHAGLLSSYLALHSWEHSAPGLLRSAFRFLPLSDLVRGVRRTCRRWHQALQPLDNDAAQQDQGWEASQSLQLPASVSSSAFVPLCTPALLSIFASLPLLRSLSFVAAVHQRNGGFDPGFEWASAFGRMVILLPRLTTLKLEAVPLKTKDLAALLPSAAASSQAELSLSSSLEDGLSAAQLLRPSVCHLTSLELLYCLAVDVRVMELLSLLPSLASLTLHSTEALTASRACGLQLLSNSGSAVQGPLSPIASAARMPSFHQQLMQDAASAASSPSAVAAADACCFPSLTALSLAPLSSDAALTHLLPCTRLQRLSLTGCLSDTGLESLCVLVSLVELRVEVLYELHRSSNGGGSALSPSSAAASRRGPSLSFGSRLSADEMSSLCDGRGLVALESLRHLTALDACIPALSLRGMEAICALSQLQSLRIATSYAACSYAGAGAAQCASPLASLPTFLSLLSFLPVLRSLDLSGLAFLSDEQISFIAHPSVCGRLRQLSLRGLHALSDTATYWLTKLRALQALDLRGCSGMRERRGIKELRESERMKDCVILWSAAEQEEEEEEEAVPEPIQQQVENAESASSARSITSQLSEPIRSRAAASPPPLPPRSSSAASDRTDSPMSPLMHQHQQQQQQHLGLAYSFAPASPSAAASKSRAEQESEQIAALAAASARATAALQMRAELTKAESILRRLTSNMAATVASNEARKNATPSPTPTPMQHQQQQPLQSPNHARSASFAESRDRPLSPSDFASPVRPAAAPPATASAATARQSTSVRPPTPKLLTPAGARKAKSRSSGSTGDARLMDDADASEWMLQPMSADPASPTPMTNGSFAAASHRPFDPSPSLPAADSRRAAAAAPAPAVSCSPSALDSASDATVSASLNAPFELHAPASSTAAAASQAAHHRVTRSSPPRLTHAHAHAQAQAQTSSSSLGRLSRDHVDDDDDDAAAPSDSHRSHVSSASSASSRYSLPLAPHALFKHTSLFDGAMLAPAPRSSGAALVPAASAAPKGPAVPAVSASSPVIAAAAPADDAVSLHRTPRMRRTKSTGTPTAPPVNNKTIPIH